MMTYIESRINGVRKVWCQVGANAVRMTLQPDKVTHQIGRGTVHELTLPPNREQVTLCQASIY